MTWQEFFPTLCVNSLLIYALRNAKIIVVNNCLINGVNFQIILASNNGICKEKFGLVWLGNKSKIRKSLTYNIYNV